MSFAFFSLAGNLCRNAGEKEKYIKPSLLADISYEIRIPMT